MIRMPMRQHHEINVIGLDSRFVEMVEKLAGGGGAEGASASIQENTFLARVNVKASIGNLNGPLLLPMRVQARFVLLPRQVGKEQTGG